MTTRDDHAEVADIEARNCSCRNGGGPRALVALAVLAAAVFCGETAHASDTIDDDLGRLNRHRPIESPQDVAIELRFGRYVPHADDGVPGTPFRDTFGTNNRYYGGLEVDWQALRIPYLGSFGPGFGIGYTRANAKALLRDGSGPSAQSTALEILPMYVVGVLRADVIARETPVPLVPYAKLGLGFAFWRASDAGEGSKEDGITGKGHSYGYQLALGGMLLLDFFDRQDARTADANLGLNHSYVFAEWYKSQLDGFGAADQLQVGTSTWMAGLAFEF